MDRQGFPLLLLRDTVAGLDRLCRQEEGHAPLPSSTCLLRCMREEHGQSAQDSQAPPLLALPPAPLLAPPPAPPSPFGSHSMQALPRVLSHRLKIGSLCLIATKKKNDVWIFLGSSGQRYNSRKFYSPSKCLSRDLLQMGTGARMLPALKQ